MGFKRNTKDKYGNDQPEQYVRVAAITVDYRSKRVAVELEHYSSVQARVENRPGINSTQIFMGDDFEEKFGEEKLKPKDKSLAIAVYNAVVERYEADGEIIINVEDPEPEPDPDPEPVVKNLSRSSKRR